MSELFAAIHKVARVRHMAESTEELYAMWVQRYLRHHRRILGYWKHPVEMAKPEVEQFLTWLAVEQSVSASTQNQALCALKFLYGQVLHQPLGDVQPMRARRQRRQPEALTVAEVEAVLEKLRGDRLLVGLLLYGSGLRLMEALRLRRKDLDLASKTLTARNTKTRKDRVVPVADYAVEPLRRHLERVREVWHEDVAAGYAGASFPPSLSRKYRAAPTELCWQFVFPATKLTRWSDGTLRRHHLHSSAPQKAVRRAALKAGITSRCTPHILRHSFATHYLQFGGDIRTLQQLMGHADIRTTMRYLRARDATEVESPLDRLKMAL